MPSSEPLETMIETFSIGSGFAPLLLWSVIGPSFLDASAWLRDAGDLGRELRRPFREELVQLLDRDPRGFAEGADRGRAAALQVGVAHEVDHQPVAVGELLDARLRRDLGGDLPVPLIGLAEEALGVDLDRGAGVGDGGHWLPPCALAVICLPEAVIRASMPGMSRPGRSMC